MRPALRSGYVGEGWQSHKLKLQALSQQLPRQLIELVMSYPLSKSLKS
jgi:hypothetical protein